MSTYLDELFAAKVRRGDMSTKWPGSGPRMAAT